MRDRATEYEDKRAAQGDQDRKIIEGALEVLLRGSRNVRVMSVCIKPSTH